MKSILSELQEKIQTQSTVACFIERFNIVRLLRECGFTKIKGFTLASIIEFLLALVFTHKNLYQTMNMTNKEVPFAKDTVYRVLNNTKTDWRQLQLKLGAEIINNHLTSLTSEERVRAVVFDDSPYSRNRSKKVELLARIKDHVTGRYFKGFRKFTAGWTDGATFIPLATTLLSSKEAKNRLYEQGPDVPKGSPGEQRRAEAKQPGTKLTLDMLDQILVYMQDFQYVLFDSWFSWPAVIKGVKERQRDVICMLKDMPNILYNYQGQSYRLSSLYKTVPKQAKKKNYIASVVVDYYGIPARIIFVHNRNGNKKREWLALLSTDINLAEEEVIRIYGLRWDIGVSRRTQYLIGGSPTGRRDFTLVA